MKLLGIIWIAAVSALAAPQVFAQCDIPAGYLNGTSVQDGDYWVGFATDKSEYAPGELVDFYLVVKNTSAVQQSFNFGLTPAEAFGVIPDACASILDCADDLYIHPAIVYYYHPGITLDPGECEVFTHTTTASPFNQSHAGQDFDAQGGLYQADLTGTSWAIPANGLTLTVSVLDDVSARVTSWGAVKVRYR